MSSGTERADDIRAAVLAALARGARGVEEVRASVRDHVGRVSAVEFDMALFGLERDGRVAWDASLLRLR